MKSLLKPASLALPLLLAASPLLRAAEKVSFTTRDGVRIVGEWSAPAAPGKPTLILLHGLGSVRQEWKPFDAYLASQGLGLLIYDARGHSESNRTVSGEGVDFQAFIGQGLDSPWGKMIGDLGDAVKYLSASKRIDPRTVAVGGASIGANVAFRYAAAHPEVPFAVLLSPGYDYQGIRIDDLLPGYGARPLFIAVSPLDRYSYQSVQMLQSLAVTQKGRRTAMTVHVEADHPGHGVQMLKRASPDQPAPLEKKIAQWARAQSAAWKR